MLTENTDGDRKFSSETLQRDFKIYDEMMKNTKREEEERWGQGDLTWHEVHVGLGDSGASCYRQMGMSGVKGQVILVPPPLMTAHCHDNRNKIMICDDLCQ